MRRLTERVGKCGVTRSYLVVYYPCCGDVDIEQLETYGYILKLCRLKLDGGFYEGVFLAKTGWRVLRRRLFKLARQPLHGE